MKIALKYIVTVLFIVIFAGIVFFYGGLAWLLFYITGLLFIITPILNFKLLSSS